MSGFVLVILNVHSMSGLSKDASSFFNAMESYNSNTILRIKELIKSFDKKKKFIILLLLSYRLASISALR